MLELQNVSASYGEVLAVDDVSITVDRGEWVSLIGPNGAGKTSVLKTILGLLDHEGDIAVNGSNLSGQAPWARQSRGIGYVPEGRRLFPDMTVEENLRVGGYRLSDKEWRQDLDEVYTLFPRVQERRRQLARTLSGGEQQLVALGRALMSRPRLLLVDEASLGLMPINVNIVFNALSGLHDEGLAILLVEQNARKALKYVDRAYVMETGKIMLSGAADEVADNPQIIESYLG